MRGDGLIGVMRQRAIFKVDDALCQKVREKYNADAREDVAKIMRPLGDAAAEHGRIQDEQGDEEAPIAAQNERRQRRDGGVERGKGDDAAEAAAQNRGCCRAQTRQMFDRRCAGKSQNAESRPIDQSDWTGRWQQRANNRRDGERESEGKKIDSEIAQSI